MAVTQRVEISPPNLQEVAFTIRGTTPLVMCAFPEKVRRQMVRIREAGDKAKNRNKREPKDFKAEYESAKHKSEEGWCGIPAAAFRGAMISACRIAGFVMTRAKLSLFIKADGLDASEFTPLVRITKGDPEYFESVVRVADGTPDICARPLWKPGWEAIVKIEYDADQMSLEDVTNLLMRAGKQVGLLEGRPDSKKSCGQGWGLFELVGEERKRSK